MNALSLPLLMGLIVISAASWSCEPVGDLLGESDQYNIGLQATPAEIITGNMFSLAVSVCAVNGKAYDGVLDVTAWMPAHNHGMNYKPAVIKEQAGRFFSEGFQFHMPGQWQFVVELEDGERVAIDTVILK